MMNLSFRKDRLQPLHQQILAVWLDVLLQVPYSVVKLAL